MRPILAGVAGLAVASVILAVVLVGDQGSASAPSFVASYARAFATGTGDSGTVDGQWVVTTRDAGAQLMSGDQVGSDQRVYLVVLYGSFVDTKAYVPLGGADPSGTTLYFEMDAVTHDVLDFGLTSATSKLASLGGVHPFSLPGFGPGR